MKLKIILNTNPFFSASASANRWLTLIQGLNDRGAELSVIVVGNYQNYEELKQMSDASSYKGIAFKYLTQKLIKGLWHRRYHKYIGSKIQAVKLKMNLRQELCYFKGIVWVENDLTLWKIIASFKQPSFKLVSEMSEFLDIHNFNRGNALQKRHGNNKKQYFENIYIHKLDGFVLMTKTLIKHYQGCEKHPPLLHLPMTVDLDRFNQESLPPSEFKKPYMAFVGVMNNAKDGVDILIESFAQMEKEFPELCLYLVGARNYDTPGHLKRIEELQLEGRIKWMGEYPRDVIPSIISNADLLVLPRPDSKQAQGGFPTKLGEYLATGVPVCATTVGEIPDYLKDNASVYFAEPGSVDSFTAAMRRALNNPVQAKEVGKNGQDVAKTYFNKNIQSQLLHDFFKSLLNENPK